MTDHCLCVSPEHRSKEIGALLLSKMPEQGPVILGERAAILRTLSPFGKTTLGLLYP